MKKVTLLCLFLFWGCEVFAGKNYIVHPVGDDYDVSSKEHNNYVHKPYPYQYGYNIKDEKGNNQWHKEESDEYNYKKGSYGYTDAYGVYRHVDYIADDKGFRAKIRTNEPGTANYDPADVYIQAEEPPHHVSTLYPQKPHYVQEPLVQQQEEYESYNPNAKDRVAYVPVYAPAGNSKGKEYYPE